MPMRQPVAGAQVQLDIAEHARPIVSLQRGVAEVWTRATIAPPLEDEAIGRAGKCTQRCATPCARRPARRQFLLAHGDRTWCTHRCRTPRHDLPPPMWRYAGQME